jgi:hypothetical protein
MKLPATSILGLVLVVFGAVVALWASADTLPERGQLSAVKGELRSLEKVASRGGGFSAVLVDATSVYEIGVGPKTIRPYAEVADAWRVDDRIGRWLGYAFIFAGAVFLVLHFRRRK